MVVRLYIILVYFEFLHILTLSYRCDVNKDMGVRASMRACVRACVRACERECVRQCKSDYVGSA